MNTVLFSVANLDRLGEVIRMVRKRLKAAAIEPLYPDSKNSDLARDFYVELDGKHDAEDAARALRQVPGVVDVEVPAPRKLIA